MKPVFIRSSYYYYCEKQICMRCTVTQLARGSYMREFELSHSNLINRIIKIIHTHNLHVKMLDFAPLKICRWKKAYCLRDYFAQAINFNKSPPFLTSAVTLCIIHYFTSNRMIVFWNTDFYSSHVIPLKETISNYFVNWLLPSLFANAKVRHTSLLRHWVK